MDIFGFPASRHVRTELRKRLAKGARWERQEILADGYPALRQCYDHLQDAREHEEEFYFYVYKLVETVEDQFGKSQTNLEHTLRVNKEVRFIKRITNDKKCDARHPPGVGSALDPPSPAERETAMSHSNVILQKFEQFSRR